MPAAVVPRIVTVSVLAVVLVSGAGAQWLATLVPPSDRGSLTWLLGLPVALGVGSVGLSLLVRNEDQQAGPADLFTLVRAAFVALVAAWATLAALGDLPARSWLLLALAALALALDGLDGAVARATQGPTAAGGVLDAETDAVMMLAMAVIVAQTVGMWILAAGALRYLFGLVWLMRWRPRVDPLPARQFRRFAAGASCALLIACTAPLTPTVFALALAALGLMLLLASFGSDALWLEVRADRGIVGHVIGRSPLQRGVDPSDILTQDAQTKQLQGPHGRDDDHR